MRILRETKTIAVRQLFSDTSKVIELWQCPTYYCIKVFYEGQPMPIKVHTGTKSYITKIFAEYGATR